MSDQIIDLDEFALRAEKCSSYFLTENERALLTMSNKAGVKIETRKVAVYCDTKKPVFLAPL